MTEDGGWKWGVTVGTGDEAKTLHGVADGPHQASEMAIHVREQLLREQEIRRTHYRNEQGEEIVVLHNSDKRGDVIVNTVWIQDNNGDAYTYIRKIDLAHLLRRNFAPDNTLRHLVDLINSF